VCIAECLLETKLSQSRNNLSCGLLIASNADCNKKKDLLYRSAALKLPKDEIAISYFIHKNF
jgi:hypothetical protein